MKICIITSPFHELPPIAIGAVEKLFYLLAGEWVKNGNRVAFVCCGGGDDDRMEFVRLKKYKRAGSTIKDLVWDFFYSVKALWKCPKTDILLCNTFWTPALAPLFRWKYRRLVYGVHRYPKGQFWLYPFVHAFICVSTVVASALKSELGNSSRVGTIINPIDNDVFNSTGLRKPIKGRVLYAGRVHPAKGLSCLAKAYKRLYEHGECSELVLVGAYEKGKGGGGDEFIKALRNIAVPCPVTVTGAISDPWQLAELERTAEVFVYPSEDALGEACPVAPMEAMALGVPTVVSDMQCYDDYVKNHINAKKFAVGNAEDLANKITEILEDLELARKLSFEGGRIACEFSKRQVAGRYEQTFKSILKRRSGNVK